jgi:tRNA1(Val) A37 N6-methylase TrmN6
MDVAAGQKLISIALTFDEWARIASLLVTVRGAPCVVRRAERLRQAITEQLRPAVSAGAAQNNGGK